MLNIVTKQNIKKYSMISKNKICEFSVKWIYLNLKSQESVSEYTQK